MRTDFQETMILSCNSMSLEFLCQGYNKVNQKCFSFTLEKGPRTAKYIYVKCSEDTRVSYYNDVGHTISTMKPV